ncbi:MULTISPECIES: fatty acyl-AMP ligase [unclassified Burkholderia]|uniref:fatty acyl-AMP ligase n=1 Tax=unclassified Burkholderia TaxID=2613784 RepID=UPI000F585D92|nr:MULTISPECIES: fatty acyl-AMP ligase [unclassified Burkholderia]RQR70563.1 AMP-binding protein [Burkholderia sp. Bp9012]RQR77840.1 AMP-binding protein [Burkholderia sp. Bp9011]RQR87836.1 AMP-binding protein [Burkholderia sp. Bp9010]RQZ43776.1 AMP-binding protein [Burkholderia sp. Bp9099]
MNLRELLEKRASEDQPDSPAYIFLADGEDAEERLTSAQLLSAANRIGGALRDDVAAGARVLLVYPSGLEFIKAFFGAVCAGTVAVPIYPPSRKVTTDELAHFERVAADCGAEIALTTGAYLDQLAPTIASSPVLGGIRWLATDALLATGWTPEAIDGDSLALLQYTSGSTSKPKGVMLTHGNLLSNMASIHEAFGGFHHRLRCASWLPLYHDMGLIGTMLTPFFGGAETIFMSPAHFLQRPIRWLRMIDRYRVTVSGGPNFAYDLCVRGVSTVAKTRLDLSTWKVAFNGSEPVRSETLTRFRDRFADSGFASSAFMPCYGLAESALLVAACRFDREPSIVGDRAPHHHDGTQGQQRERVTCGPCAPSTTITIVDPVDCSPVPPGAEGEVWVRSASVAAGYWHSPELTNHTFAARLARTDDDPDGARAAAGTWLRTGDLGRMHGDELLITGRLKDVMVINGRKIHPQDVEDHVQSLDRRFRLGGGIAFVVEEDGYERVALVQEVNAGSTDEAAGLAALAREFVFRRFRVALHGIALVAPGGVPKTFNGKLRRQACRQAYAEGALPTLYAFKAGAHAVQGRRT